jgi:hypothetical protein
MIKKYLEFIKEANLTLLEVESYTMMIILKI